MSEQGEAVIGERKIVSVLFCDLVESTALGERLDPEALKRVHEAYFDRMRTLVEHHGGTVEKFIGDAVVAVFGVPQIHEDDAERAVRCALAMLDAVEGLNDTLRPRFGVELEVRIGIDSGEAMTTAGDQSIATGDVTNTAARLEQAAETGGILVGRETFLLTERSIDYRARPAVSAKGKAKPVEAWFPVGISAGPRRPRTPMTGRGSELETLAGALERAVAAGKPQMVVILGEPGIGKSRLAEEFAARAEGRARVLRGASLPYGEGTAWRPIAEMVKSEAGILESHPSETALARLAKRLAERHPPEEASLIEAQIGPLLGASRASGTSGPEILWALRRYLESLATAGPLVILFDDLHWADRILLETVQELAETLASGAIVFVLLGRPEVRERLTGLVEGKHVITLEPLPEPDALVLVTHLRTAMGAHWSEDQEVDIVHRAQGNPLFLEEIGAWVGEEAGERPRTLHALLAARIDLLPVEAKRVAQGGAVVGEVFWDGAVAAIVDGEDVAASVRVLRTRGLIDEDEETAFLGYRQLRFHHNLIRDVAYESLSKGDRSQMHRGIADWLESRAGERPDLWVAIAHHLDRAVALAAEVSFVESPDPLLADAAAGAYLRAAGWTASNAALPEAAEMLRRGAQLGASPELSGVCRARRAYTLALAGELDEAVEEAEAVLEHEPSQTAVAIAAMAVAQGQYLRVDDLERLRRSSQRALELAQAQSLPDMEARALDLLAWYEMWAKETEPHGFRLAEQLWRKSADVALRIGDLAHAAKVTAWLATFLAAEALDLTSAEEAAKSAMELGRSSGSLLAMAIPHFGMAWVRFQQDRLEDAIGHGRETLRLCLDSGDKAEAAAACAFILGPSLRFLGRLEESLDSLDLGISLSAEVGRLGWDPNLRIERSRTLLAMGQVNLADRELAELAPPMNHHDWMDWTTALAGIRAAQGRDQEAEDLWRTVLSRPWGRLRPDAVKAAVGLAGFFALRGRASEARSLIQEARSWLEGTSAPFLERRIREVEATLAGD